MEMTEKATEKTVDLAFVLRVLAAVSFDYTDDLWWRTDGEYAPVTFFITCNDVFAWACSDLEQVTPDNVHMLEQAIKDCEAVGGRLSGPTLFCARVRGMRPQGAVLKEIDKPAVRALFDAVGPKRAIDLGNPYEHPDDGGSYAYNKDTK